MPSCLGKGGIFGRVLSPKNALIWFDVFAFQVSGLGKLSPNSVMVGFKQDWKEDPVKDHHKIVFIFPQKLSGWPLRLSASNVLRI